GQVRAGARRAARAGARRLAPQRVTVRRPADRGGGPDEPRARRTHRKTAGERVREHRGAERRRARDRGDDRSGGATPSWPEARRTPPGAGAPAQPASAATGLSEAPMARPIVLAVDVGGSHVKALASNQKERRRFNSGPSLTAEEMVSGTLEAVAGWNWSRVTVGIPSPVRAGKVISEPVNLGDGWVGFD